MKNEIIELKKLEKSRFNKRRGFNKSAFDKEKSIHDEIKVKLELAIQHHDSSHQPSTNQPSIRRSKRNYRQQSSQKTKTQSVRNIKQKKKSEENGSPII